MDRNDGGNVKEGWSAWWSFARIPEFPVEAEKTALIVIDMTYQQAHRNYGLCKRIIESGFENDLSYYLDRIDRVVVPNLQRLIAAFRSVDAPMVYTRCASLVGDGSDQTWRHRHFGVVTTVDSKDGRSWSRSRRPTATSCSPSQARRSSPPLTWSTCCG